MQRLFSAIARRPKTIVWVWILAAIVATAVGEPSREHTVNDSSGALPLSSPSVIADAYAKEFLGSEPGIPALLTFHAIQGISPDQLQIIAQATEHLTDPDNFPDVRETIPLYRLPDRVQSALLSDDGTTFLLPVVLHEHLDLEEISQTVGAISEWFAGRLNSGVELYITGPAGIAADAIGVFQNADLVLLFSTLGIILVLLMLIYRSPLLALIPLLAAAIVYQVVDPAFGLMGSKQWLRIESQSISIMLILLFAAITDYSMFVFSRFREQLKVHDDKVIAMESAMTRVAEPIFYSGGTVLAGVAMLGAALYVPYRNFAPVFGIAMVFILLAGVTLIPALFTLFGRAAFWPMIPKVGQPAIAPGSFWKRMGVLVTSRPYVTGAVVLVVFLALATNVTHIRYSFNLLESFPADTPSRVGFELLAENYAPGNLAPTTVVLTSTDPTFSIDHVKAVAEQLRESPLVAEVSLDDGAEIATAADGSSLVAFELTLPGNPYSLESLDAVERLMADRPATLTAAGLSPTSSDLHFSGETARQVDVRTVNTRDTRWVIALVTIIITAMLALHTRSLIAPLYMMGTILVSFAAALGLSTWIFQNLWGYDAMSYRIPLYTFVFLVALGVDYNIILVSRIREEIRERGTLQSVRNGVTMTGGVISSAGVILAATFAVLMTQPVMDLFMFGFAMSIGILMDTFLVRGILLPSIVTILGKWSFWPSGASANGPHAEPNVAKASGTSVD